MGLLSVAASAIGSTMKDQYKEFFSCDSMDANTLVVRGTKVTNGKNKGSDNIISDGSVISVADGQCMIIVEQGKVVDLCAEPGEFVYDMSTEPSIFSGKLGEAIKGTFSTMWKRFTFGGDTAKDQRVYYFNTKEIMGNKYGTPSPVPFRVVDTRADIDIDISVRCFGEYSYRIVNPVPFYVNVCGNVTDKFTRDKIDSQLKSELLTALQPAFAPSARWASATARWSATPRNWLTRCGKNCPPSGASAASRSRRSASAASRLPRKTRRCSRICRRTTIPALLLPVLRALRCRPCRMLPRILAALLWAS